MLYISDFHDQLNQNGFVVYELGSGCNITQCYHRKDFYKVSLISGKGEVECDGNIIEINGSVIVIAPPTASISWRIIADNYPSYTCIFTQSFLQGCEEFWILQDDHLFNKRKPSTFNIKNSSLRFITMIFQRMLADQTTLYPFKRDLFRRQINLLIHEALKSQPATISAAGKAGQFSVATLFVELLERQFPLVGQVIHWN